MAALRIHHDSIDIVGIAFPLEPRSLGPAGLVGAVAALDHDAFDHRIGRRGAQRIQLVPC